MKLIEAASLFQALNAVAVATEKDPKDFTVAIKLAVAHNLRLATKHFMEHEEERVALVKKHGAQEKEGDRITVPTENMPAFLSEMEGVNNRDVGTHFRRIYESQIGDSALTVGQISILQQCGLLITNTAPVPLSQPTESRT